VYQGLVELGKVRGLSPSRLCEDFVREGLSLCGAKGGVSRGDRVLPESPRSVEKTTVAQRRLDLALDSSLSDALESRPDLIAGLDPKVLADLIAKRAPRPQVQDEGLRESYLSLRSSLSHLPEVGDLDGALRKRSSECDRLRATVRLQSRGMSACRALAKDGVGDRFCKLLSSLIDDCVETARKHDQRCYVLGRERDQFKLWTLFARSLRVSTSAFVDRERGAKDV